MCCVLLSGSLVGNGHGKGSKICLDALGWGIIATSHSLLTVCTFPDGAGNLTLTHFFLVPQDWGEEVKTVHPDSILIQGNFLPVFFLFLLVSALGRSSPCMYTLSFSSHSFVLIRLNLTSYIGKMSMYLQGSGRGWQQKEGHLDSCQSQHSNGIPQLHWSHSIGRNWSHKPTCVQAGLGMKSLGMKSFAHVLWLSGVISQNAGRLGAEFVLTQISCSTGQDNT